MQKEIIIAQTKKWIVDVVVGNNFCPFAAREVKRDSIFFQVLADVKQPEVLLALNAIFSKMNDDRTVETSFLIVPQGFSSFANYLKLVKAAEGLLKKMGYEGLYQVASFHPDYLFAGSPLNDPAHYTNRSPYPMLHVLREESVSRAIEGYPDINKIPQNNIAFTRQKGLLYMQQLRSACMQVDQ